jgi:hypothetical protein
MDSSTTKALGDVAGQVQPQQATTEITVMASAKKTKLDDVDSDSDGPPPSPPRPFSFEKKKKPMSSLQKQTEKIVLRQITEALSGIHAPAQYCCGGRILTTLSPESSTTLKHATTPVSPPIVLRWDDPTENDAPRRIRLPIAVGTSKGNSVAFSVIDNSRLLKACNPSGTLPGSQFSTNFDPHYLGIIDVVAQALLPGIESSLLQGRPEHRGVSAQLTHLQVSMENSVLNPSSCRNVADTLRPFKRYQNVLAACSSQRLSWHSSGLPPEYASR